MHHNGQTRVWHKLRRYGFEAKLPRGDALKSSAVWQLIRVQAGSRIASRVHDSCATLKACGSVVSTSKGKRRELDVMDGV